MASDLDMDKVSKSLTAISNRLNLLDRKITELEIKKADKPKYSKPINLGKPICFGRYTPSCFNCDIGLSCEEETKGD
jgi:hypothetical protein